jgi:hypothetical protein
MAFPKVLPVRPCQICSQIHTATNATGTTT